MREFFDDIKVAERTSEGPILRDLESLFQSEKLEKAATVDLEEHPHTEGRHKVQGSVDPMFAAVFRNSGTFLQQFSRNFPRVFQLPHRPQKQPQPSRVF